jgi:DNA-binding MarR family transcriptional regulator
MNKTRLIKQITQLQHKVFHAMGQHTPDAWMDLNLTIGQLKSLFYIDFEGSTNFKSLATALGVTSPDVTRIVDRLVKQGLVTRQESPADRRMLLLQTTEKGRALIARLQQRRMTHMYHVLSQLNTEELSTIAKGLAALAKATEARPGENPE